MTPPDRQQLFASLRQVNTIQEPLEREYALVVEALRFGIPVEEYRRMLGLQQEEDWSRARMLRAFVSLLTNLEQRLKVLLSWLRQLSVFELSALLGQLTVLIATLSYFRDAPKREQQRIRELRAEVNATRGDLHSFPRIRGLQLLAEACEGWPGLELPGANLAGLELGPCRTMDLRLDALPRLSSAFQERGFDLSHANLARSDLSGVNLRKAVLAGANLKGAVLRGADLRGADLSGADLREADLTGARLQEAVLRGARLEQASLDRAHLQGANLYDANLSRAILPWASLTGANLSRARLEGANLNRADLRRADLYQTHLEEALLLKADLRQASLVAAYLSGARLDGARLPITDQLEGSRGGAPRSSAPASSAPVIALVRDNAEDVFFQNVGEGMRQALRHQVPGASLPTCETGTGESASSREAQCVDTLLARGVDAIVIAPKDPVDSIPIIKKAYEAGVAIICYDRCVSAEGLRYVSGTFQSDQLELGRQAGEALARWVERQGRHDQEVRLGVLHCGDNENCYTRYLGLRRVLDQRKISWREVAIREGWTPAEASGAATRILAGEEVEVLWSANGTGTEALVAAAAASPRRDRLAIFGTDINPTLARWLLPETGPALLQAVSGQSPHDMGRCAVEAALAILQREVSRPLSEVCLRAHMPSRLYSREEPEAVRGFLAEQAGPPTLQP